MRVALCDGQLSIDFEADGRSHMDWDAWWKEWLRDVKGVSDPELFRLYDRIREKFGADEARERSKTFDLVTMKGLTVDELVRFIGVLDAPHYHVCWDRSWAYKMGVPKEELPNIYELNWYGRKKPEKEN